jgi:4'-phosphopantetheinyl transferase
MTEWRPELCSAPGEDEVHVWRARLDGCSESLPALRAVLSAEEHARAARFHFEDDRRRFTLGRGLLRVLLGRCIGCAPQELAFRTGAYGKPSLEGGPPVEFNVSHSGAFVLLSLAWRRRLGIDVERIRADMATTGIAEEFFSLAECRDLAGLSGALRTEAFFACWTRKEAYIKATGYGLSLPLDQFDVVLLPGEPPGLRATRHDPADVTRWTLRELDVAAGYKAALAVEGADWTLVCRDWRETAGLAMP